MSEDSIIAVVARIELVSMMSSGSIG